MDIYNTNNNNLEVFKSLAILRANICKLIGCTINKVQFYNNFIICKIKDTRSNLWKHYKFKVLKDGI